VLGAAALPVDPEHVSRVALEEHAHVGLAGVAAGDDVKQLPFGAQAGDAAALLVQERADVFRRHVVRDELRFGGNPHFVCVLGQLDGFGGQGVAVFGLSVGGLACGFLGGGLG
jgi:hypothetical protein